MKFSCIYHTTSKHYIRAVFPKKKCYSENCRRDQHTICDTDINNDEWIKQLDIKEEETENDYLKVCNDCRLTANSAIHNNKIKHITHMFVSINLICELCEKNKPYVYYFLIHEHPK